MDNFIAMGLHRSHKMTESDIHVSKMLDGIGVKWKDLARALGFTEATIKAIETEKSSSSRECCIELLAVRWLGREGTDATAGKLADAFKSIQLKNLADNLIGEYTCCQCNCISQRNEDAKALTDPYQINKCNANTMISNLTDQLAILKKEVLRMSTKIEGLEQENEKLRARLGSEGARQHEQEDLGNKEDFSTDTDQATRAHLISVKLKNVTEQLHTYVTSPLEVPEVTQDQLTTPAKLDLLTRLSERLQGFYSEIQGMITETCKCSEDLKREFYDFSYHGLRAEHNDLVHRVNDLEFAVEEMSEGEKKKFKRLQGYQINRQRQVERLDKLWKGLFSPPESLPKTVSEPASNKPSDADKKVSERTSTHPGARPKQPKPRENVTTNDDDKSDIGVQFKFPKQKSAVKSLTSIFKRNQESGEKTCSGVSYSPRRDS